MENQKTLHFIVGLPRSGSTLLTNIFKQNPKIHGEAVSSLSALVGNINYGWNNFEANKEYTNTSAKIGVIKGVLAGYHSHINKPIIIDKDRSWISNIAILEEILQRKMKMIVCVRNPAEILSSFEKMRKNNPLFVTGVDSNLGSGSNIASRAMYYAGPGGVLGANHKNVKDAITMGYLDRLLFVDYNRLCNTPKAQMKRIYEFLELDNYEHDFNNITQEEKYNDLAVGLPNLHKIKNSIDKTTINCVEYLGLELYEQYNREIFWNAWI